MTVWRPTWNDPSSMLIDVLYTHTSHKLTHLTPNRRHGRDDASSLGLFKKRLTWDLKSLIIFATYFCMEMPHFEYGWLIGEEICLSRWYQFSFNIHPQLFLQEIAILFIYYLFLGLLDLIDFENEKPFIAHDRLLQSSLLSIIRTLETRYR